MSDFLGGDRYKRSRNEALRGQYKGYEELQKGTGLRFINRAQAPLEQWTVELRIGFASGCPKAHH